LKKPNWLLEDLTHLQQVLDFKTSRMFSGIDDYLPLACAVYSEGAKLVAFEGATRTLNITLFWQSQRLIAKGEIRRK
jgi:hypothetical protein